MTLTTRLVWKKLDMGFDRTEHADYTELVRKLYTSRGARKQKCIIVVVFSDICVTHVRKKRAEKSKKNLFDSYFSLIFHFSVKV